MQLLQAKENQSTLDGPSSSPATFSLMLEVLHYLLPPMYNFIQQRVCEGGVIYFVVPPSPKAVVVYEHVFTKLALILKSYVRRFRH